MSEWKDASSYSRGQRGTIEPTAWQLEVGYLRIVLHRKHGLDPTQWYGTVHGFDRIDSTEIGEPGTSDRYAKELLISKVHHEFARHLVLLAVLL